MDFTRRAVVFFLALTVAFVLDGVSGDRAVMFWTALLTWLGVADVTPERQRRWARRVRIALLALDAACVALVTALLW